MTLGGQILYFVSLAASFSPSLHSGANVATWATNKHTALQKAGDCPIIEIFYLVMADKDWAAEVPSQPDGHVSVERKTSGQFSILETQESYELEHYKQLYEETRKELNSRNELLTEKTQEVEKYKELLVQLTQDLKKIQCHEQELKTQNLLFTEMIQQMERDKKVSIERIQELERENKVLTEKIQQMENNEQLSNERMRELEKQKQLLKTMGEKLQCSICLDVVRQALSLRCGHSFCSQCIMTWICENRRAQNGPFCPACRSPDCSTMRILMLCGVANDFRAFNNATRDEVEEEHNNELFAATQTARLSSSDEEDDVFHDALEELNQ